MRRTRATIAPAVLALGALLLALWQRKRRRRAASTAVPLAPRTPPRPPRTPARAPATPSLSTGLAGDSVRHVLVHNVSHADMVVSLGESGSESSDTRSGLLLARPRFSTFKLITQLLEDCVGNHRGFEEDGHDADGGEPLISVQRRPAFLRSNSSARYPIASPSPGRLLPVGLKFAAGCCPSLDDKAVRANFKVRQEGKADVPPSLAITGVYFPLLAVLIPKWTRWIQESIGSDGNPKATVFLVSGVGTPRNQSHELMGNSTDGVARLMEAWLSRVYPALEVIRVHSLSNLFRYDENIAFVNHELLPKIEAMRDELALQYAARWRELLRITISFAVRAPSIPPPTTTPLEVLRLAATRFARRLAGRRHRAHLGDSSEPEPLQAQCPSRLAAQNVSRARAYRPRAQPLSHSRARYSASGSGTNSK